MIRMRAPISRRDFLKQTALATAVVSAIPLGAARITLGSTRKRVVVIGAGLAGLSAAYELSRAGYEVTLLEARTRAGGRIQTLRDPFSDALYAEAGGTRIPDVHDWTLRYTQEFSLDLVPFRQRGLDELYHLRGRRLREGEEEWPFNLAPEERRLGLSGMGQRYLASAFSEIGDPTAPDWPTPRLATLDRTSTAELLRSRGASAEAVALYTALGLGDPDPERLSSLFTLRNRFLLSKAKQWYKIRGGNDLLPKAFTARLSGRIRYGTPVVKVVQDRNEARVTFRQGQMLETIAADRVVCTVPLPLLREISFDPPLSPAKQRAAREIPYAPVTKVFIQSRTRFWTEEGLSGFAATDLPIEEVWDLSAGQPGPRGILVAYTTGREAEQFSARPEAERLLLALDHMDQVFPGLRQQYEGGASKAWHDDPWARGAYPAFQIGQVSLLPELRRSEGRIHFAGDHASAWPAWMQGALESGNRAAREIEQAL